MTVIQTNKVPPKISCLMITHNRLELLKRAVKCYCDQTYENRELVIVSNGSNDYNTSILEFLSSVESSTIQCEFLEPVDYVLGRLRNISMSIATGEIICQWDDDDLYHPERLTIQANHMLQSNAQVSFFTDQLQFIWEDQSLYWINWLPKPDARMQLIPGTLMMFKNNNYQYPEYGKYARKGEDDAFIDQFYSALKIARLSSFGYLYVYSYHGKNTFPKKHHQALSKFCSVDFEFVKPKLNDLSKALRYYHLPNLNKIYLNNNQIFHLDICQLQSN